MDVRWRAPDAIRPYRSGSVKPDQGLPAPAGDVSLGADTPDDASRDRNNVGSTRALLRLTVQCRCGPVTRPVMPISPIFSPRAIRFPFTALIRLRWLYIVTSPWPWSRNTVLPLKK